MMRLMLAFALILPLSAFSQLNYPQTNKIVNIETRFGVDISDDYKWMDNPSNPELYDWIEEQQQLTVSQLDPQRMNFFIGKLKEYADLAKKLELEQRRNSVVQQTQTSVAFAPIMKLFETKEEPKGDLVTAPKNKRKYKVEQQPIFGGDLARLKIVKTEDNSVVDIILVKFFALVDWIDEETFLYTSQVDGSLGGTRAIVALHKVGMNQADDAVLFKATHNREGVAIRKISNKYYLEQRNYTDYRGKLSQIDLNNGQLHLTQDLGKGAILAAPDEKNVLVRNDDNVNNGEILILNMLEGSKKTLIPDLGFVLTNIKTLPAGDLLFEGHFDAESVNVYYKAQDGSMTQIAYEESGSLKFRSPNQAGNLEFEFQSYGTPKKILEYNLTSNTFTEVSAQVYPVEIESKKLHYTASNGEQAAMWVISKKGVTLNENTPMIIYGYGGFDITLLPRFNTLAALPWLELGGAVTVVSLPGSLTYGREWNLHAKKGKRVNSWDSFAAAGVELVKQGLTSHARLGMAGGSNGGLLVAGTLQRHSDKFKAAIPMVGVLDLLNYNLFSAGKYWEWEYGNPFIESDFNELKEISPYHNLEQKNYPAVMVMTAEFDDRVVPSHSYKYVAKMQELHTGNTPVLLYNKEWGGHSSRSGSEFQKLAFQAAMFTFFAQHLGI